MEHLTCHAGGWQEPEWPTTRAASEWIDAL